VRDTPTDPIRACVRQTGMSLRDVIDLLADQAGLPQEVVDAQIVLYNHHGFQAVAEFIQEGCLNILTGKLRPHPIQVGACDDNK
jgi:hypothetical protein